jgi:hypothetical protein
MTSQFLETRQNLNNRKLDRKQVDAAALEIESSAGPFRGPVI